MTVRRCGKENAEQFGPGQFRILRLNEGLARVVYRRRNDKTGDGGFLERGKIFCVLDESDVALERRIGVGNPLDEEVGIADDFSARDLSQLKNRFRHSGGEYNNPNLLCQL